MSCEDTSYDYSHQLGAIEFQLGAVERRLGSISDAIRDPEAEGWTDDSGTYVNCLTEAVMGNTAALNRIGGILDARLSEQTEMLETLVDTLEALFGQRLPDA